LRYYRRHAGRNTHYWRSNRGLVAFKENWFSFEQEAATRFRREAEDKGHVTDDLSQVHRSFRYCLPSKKNDF
jgi:hypothetical protein